MADGLAGCRGRHPGHQPRRLRLPRRPLRSRRGRHQRAEPVAASPTPAAAGRDRRRSSRDRGVTTVYTETLVDPAVAETVADEAGVGTAVLDPIEGLTDESAGRGLPRRSCAATSPRCRRASPARDRIRRHPPSGCAAPASATATCRSSRDVDLTVGRGEAVAVLGSNGSGKTTLARGLLGLAPVLGGEVERARRPGRPAARARPGRLRAAAAHGQRRRAGDRARGRRRRAGWPGSACSAGSAPPTAPPSADAVAAVGLADRMERPGRLALRRAAAPGARRPRAGRRAGAADHGRADRRRRRREPGGPGRRPRRACRPTGTTLLRRHPRGRPARRRPHPRGGRRRTAGSATTARWPGPAAAGGHRTTTGRRASRAGRLPARPAARSTPRPPRTEAADVEILEYDFMQRALLASLMVGLVAPAVGIFLVQRRLSLLGDGLGHVALDRCRRRRPDLDRPGRRGAGRRRPRRGAHRAGPRPRAHQRRRRARRPLLRRHRRRRRAAQPAPRRPGHATSRPTCSARSPRPAPATSPSSPSSPSCVLGRRRPARPAALRGERRRGVRARRRPARCSASTSCSPSLVARPSCCRCGSSACCSSAR